MILSQDLRIGGGAQRVVSNLTRALAQRCDVVTVMPVIERAGEALPIAGRARWIQLMWKQKPRGLSRAVMFMRRINTLARVVGDERPDVILSNYSFMWHHLAVGLKIHPRTARIPVVLRFGNPIFTEFAQRGAPSGLWMRVGARLVDRWVASSPGIAREVLQILRAPADRVLVIENPIEVEEIRRQAVEDAPEFPHANGAPVFLNVGRLAPQKNQALLLHAFREVRAHVEAHLVILGEGRLEKDLKRLAADLGIEREVSFLGWHRNPFRFMHRATAFVLSSDYEGFGLVVAEALACGTPVISTDCPWGPREILGEGRYGVLVPTQNVASLADAMLRVAGDERLRATLALAGVERARAFDAQRIGDRYLALFGELGRGGQLGASTSAASR